MKRRNQIMCRGQKVVCISKSNEHFMVGSHNNHLLELGKEYTISNVDVQDWYTLLSLEEIPNVEFNSVVFQ